MNEEPKRESDQIDDVPVPECAPKLIGHDKILQNLLSQLTADRLPGGIMLHGPRGIGKATLAFELAKRILTTTGDEPELRVREQISAGVHPNVFVLRKLPRDSKAFYTNIRVADVRQLVAKMHQTRGRVGHRICIVDSIDDCNRSSANALLKTLEEPPAETHFILVSHRPGKLLPTIRSRCQAHAMRPLADNLVGEIVSGFDADKAQIENAIQFAKGMPRRAFETLSLADADVLQQLTAWLAAPNFVGSGPHLALAKKLSNKQNELAVSFAKDTLLDWIAAEARQVSQVGAHANLRLASVNALWEKTNRVFLDAQTYNLDLQQSLITVFDAIRDHARLSNPNLVSQR